MFIAEKVFFAPVPAEIVISSIDEAEKIANDAVYSLVTPQLRVEEFQGQYTEHRVLSWLCRGMLDFPFFAGEQRLYPHPRVEQP